MINVSTQFSDLWYILWSILSTSWFWWDGEVSSDETRQKQDAVEDFIREIVVM